MNRLFCFFIILFLALTSLLLISCATVPCVKYAEFETCRETHQGEILCRNRPENINANTNEEVQVDKAQWKQEKPGRLSLRVEDFVEIRNKLRILETITCNEEELKEEVCVKLKK